MKKSDKYVEPYYLSLVELSSRPCDDAKYLALLELAVDAGDDNARYALGSLHLHGTDFEVAGWTPDPATGLRLMKLASRSVHMAMTELAMIYEAGEHGTRRSPARAFRYFARGVSYGSVVSRYHLGRCYYYGVGTKTNRRKAAALFRAASALGFPVYESPDESDVREAP